MAMEVIGTPAFNDMGGWVNAFGNIVYHTLILYSIYVAEKRLPGNAIIIPLTF